MNNSFSKNEDNINIYFKIYEEILYFFVYNSLFRSLFSIIFFKDFDLSPSFKKSSLINKSELELDKKLLSFHNKGKKDKICLFE